MMCSQMPETTSPMAKPARPEVSPPRNVAIRNSARKKPSMARSKIEAAGAWMAMHLTGRLPRAPERKLYSGPRGRQRCVSFAGVSTGLPAFAGNDAVRRAGVKRLLHLDQADGIDQAVGQHWIAIAGHGHIADDVAAARDGPGLEFLRLRVEAHDRVGLGVRLVVPERAFGEDDAVGLRARATRRGPFAHLAGLGIEAAEEAAREVGIPDDVVRSDRDAAGPRRRIGQRVFRDLHGLAVDARNLVGAELDEEHDILRVDSHAVGPRVRGRRGDELDFASLW